MSDDNFEARDAELLALFAESTDELPGEDFVAGVSAAILQARRRRRLRNTALAGLFVLIELLLGSPLTGGLGVFATALEMTLVPVQTPWLELLLAPLNSLAGVIGLSLLALHVVYRKVFQ